jgi:phosphatidylserine/phosphatidylglycerophosphate/cardiolipin synthase-like enzyme
MKGLMKGNGVKVVATGSAWIGQGVGSVESAIEDLLKEAQDEILVAAFQITEGAGQFLQMLRDCLSRGIRVTLLINRFDSQPRSVQETLRGFTEQFAHFTKVDFNPQSKFQDLHAKIIVVDRSTALVGSPNLSWKGLVLNHELGVVLSGPIASTIAHLLDALMQESSRNRS